LDTGFRVLPLRERLEYALVWPSVKILGWLPRPVARALGIAFGLTVYAVYGRLRRIGLRNLALAFPEKPEHERRRLVRGEFISLGRQLAEVCLFPRYTRENVSRVVVYDGFENFERAYARGKGVLFLTGHLGAWELSAFAHSLQGHPLSIVMRSLDNPYIDALVQSYRTMHGNAPSTRTISSAACFPPCAPATPSEFSWTPT
jgi:Kdo2-lipid IVA lauroyltransferase/acyltransferase